MDDIHEPTQSQPQGNEPETFISPESNLPSQPLPVTPLEPQVEEPVARESEERGQETLPLQNQQEQTIKALPLRKERYALITGIVMGVLGTVLTLVIILLNASLFQTARLQVIHDALTVSVALALLGIFAAIGVTLLLISLIGGLVMGRIAVLRRLGFWAGVLDGGITFLVIWLISLLPNYPDHLGGTPELGGGSLILSFLWLLLSCLAAGLVSLFGTWVVSGRHPHYRR